MTQEEGICENCKEEKDDVGSYWNGEDAETEFLKDYCEKCAIDHISGESDYIHEQYSDMREFRDKK